MGPAAAQTAHPTKPLSERLRILVTGFEPFGKDFLPDGQEVLRAVNRSQELLPVLEEIVRTDSRYKSFEVETLVLPVRYQEAFLQLQQHYLSLSQKPDWIVSLGEAPLSEDVDIRLEVGSSSQGIEAIADTAGRYRVNSHISGEKREISFSFPVQDVLCGILLARETSRVGLSISTGSYVCDDLSFRAATYFQVRNDNNKNEELVPQSHVPRFVFIHVRRQEQFLDTKSSSAVKSVREENKKIAHTILRGLGAAYSKGLRDQQQLRRASGSAAGNPWPSLINNNPAPRFAESRVEALRWLNSTRQMSRWDRACYKQFLDGLERAESIKHAEERGAE